MTRQTQLQTLRELARQYAEFALSERNRAIPDRYRQLNSLHQIRPPVLIFEIPWGEFDDCEALRCVCEDRLLRDIERRIRRDLYLLRRFPNDYALHPYYRQQIALRDSGIGIQTSEEQLAADTGTDIRAHSYHDVLPDEAALAKVQLPEIDLDAAATQAGLEAAHAVFDGILPVKKTGVGLYMASWDQIPRYHGIENSLTDLYERPEFSHALIERFTQINERRMQRYEQLNVLDTDPYYLHCTPACTYELPVKDNDTEQVHLSEVWGRAMAQIFAVVSPAMHEEFDIVYSKRLLDRCGLSYYGCCEPLDRKIDILRPIKNLRRISITPWADPDIAADAIGKDYVLSAKSNPAFVAGHTFDPEPVRAETERILKACLRNATPCEFVLKDISTVSGNPDNLIEWSKTVNGVIDEYFG